MSTTIDALQFSGVEKISVQGSTGTRTQLDNVGNIVDLELISNIGSGDIVDLNYTAAASTGTGTTQNIATNTSAATIQLAV